MLHLTQKKGLTTPQRHLKLQPIIKEVAMNKVTAKVIFWKQKMKHGAAPIYLQCFINGEKYVRSLSVTIPQKYWDEQNQKVKSTCPNAATINSIISHAKDKVMDIHNIANRKNENLSKSLFEQMYLYDNTDYDLIQFYEMELNARKKCGKIEASTYRSEKSTLTKLKLFSKKIPMQSVDEGFFEKLDRWLIANGNSPNTRGKRFTHIKSYMNLAVGQKLIQHLPYIKINTPGANTNRTFLQFDELLSLVHLYDENRLQRKQQNALLFFLTMCFTGLRISDLRALDAIWVQLGCLKYCPQKTKKKNNFVTVPLTDLATKFVQLAITNKHKMYSDQKLNENLKSIAAEAKINKRITNHVGRHTFATVFLDSTGNVIALQELLGHASISTTNIYAHLSDETKINEMQKMNLRLNEKMNKASDL